MNQYLKRLLLCSAIALLVLALAQGWAQAEPEAQPVAGQAAHAYDLGEALGLLRSEERAARDRGSRMVEIEIEQLETALAEMIHFDNRAKFSPETRAQACFLAGRLRSAACVKALASTFHAEPIDVNLRLERKERTYAVYAALIEIGRPAVPAMIEKIKADDDEVVRRRAVKVLSRILGDKNDVLILVERIEADEKDPDVRKRLSQVRREMEGRE